VSGPAESLTLSLQLERGDFRLRLDETIALDGVTAVFGRSGSGKTSLLRAIAGLDRPAMGRIALGDDVWFDAETRQSVKPYRRGAGYLFQDARLFDHLSVAGNLAFADKRSEGLGDAIAFEDVVAATGLSDMLTRNTGGLSGGERQRVALARTLLARPRLLLLDEPLTGLDRAAKREIMPYLRDVPARFGIPALFVSHDIEEVTALANRILVLDGGRVAAHGALGDVLQTLDLGPLLVDGTTGSLIEATVTGHDTALGVTRLDLAETTLSLPLDERLQIGRTVRLFVDASDVALATARPEGISIRNILPGQIKAIKKNADRPHADILVAIGQGQLRARITRASLAELGLDVGRDVFALVKTMSFAD